MRNYILPAAFAAMMTFAPIASAAAPEKTATTQTVAAPAAKHLTKVHGVIRAVDAKSHTITLDDGRTFALPANYAGSSLKPEEKVTIDWSWNKDQRVAHDVTLNN